MIISFCGSQSSGKSTLLEECKKHPNFLNFAFEPEVTRLVKREYNLPINEDAGNLTQLAILNRHLHNYLKYRDKDVFLDRCIIDGFVYTSYLVEQGKVDYDVVLYADYLVGKFANKYDIIFYTEPDIDLVDDGERSTDQTFRKRIIEIFERTLLYLKSRENIEVIRLKGTVEERMDIIYNTIKNYDK